MHWPTTRFYPEIGQMKHPKRPRDPNHLAKRIEDIAIGLAPAREPTPKKDEAAAAMGRKGGQARAKSMGSARRAEIAKAAAKKRWE